MIVFACKANRCPLRWQGETKSCSPRQEAGVEGISSVTVIRTMNYRALCFVDMSFGKKPDLKAAWSLILIKFTPRRSNRAIGVRGFVIDQSAMSASLHHLLRHPGAESLFSGDAARRASSLVTCSRVDSFIHSSGAAAKASSSRC